jgi:hypothetical protein
VSFATAFMWRGLSLVETRSSILRRRGLASAVKTSASLS